MKKIGIISLFGYYNYGNRLQLFATQKVYRDLGYESEIIRYYFPIYKEHYIIKLKILIYKLLTLKKNITEFSLKNRREKNFKRHAKIYYKESKEIINPLKVNDLFHDEYSFFSVGSDQVWGWFSHIVSDFVFLKFAPREKRVTFSPSFGSATIDEKYRETFKDGLEGFNQISVREESGKEIIKNFTGKVATVLCDPTMCLSKKDWMEFATIHEKKPKKKYILTYFLGEKSKKAERILEKYSQNYKIITLNDFQNPKYYAITPSEWVDYIKDADLFLTDSFHAVVFSLILQTPFSVYKRKGGESMQTRITNILEKFHMKDRLEIDAENPNLFNMNFDNTENLINQEKEKAIDFLKKSFKMPFSK